jgi:hypothetical protein
VKIDLNSSPYQFFQKWVPGCGRQLDKMPLVCFMHFRMLQHDQTIFGRISQDLRTVAIHPPSPLVTGTANRWRICPISAFDLISGIYGKIELSGHVECNVAIGNIICAKSQLPTTETNVD